MKIFFVAGEPSGDLLAGGLMSALRQRCPEVEFRGVGGENMAQHGLNSLFDISEISVMGVVEVIPRLPLIMKRLRQTREAIEQWQPDVIVTVDSWGFVSSLLKKLHKQGSKIPVVHYVAPQVWAWKRGRAKSVAQLVDRLMMLLPDEGKYFEKYGLRCEFVGHPVVERTANVNCDEGEFRLRNNIPEDLPIICVLPGSRRSEIKRLIPIFRKSLSIIEQRYGKFCVVVPTVPGVETEVRREFVVADIPVRIVTGTQERYNAFCLSKFALASSGTVSLELVALGVPHLIAYKFNAITNFLVNAVIKIKYANLINLLVDREVIPEFVLEKCRPQSIAECALELLSDPEKSANQVVKARKVMQMLTHHDAMPSERAAQVVLSVLGEC